MENNEETPKEKQHLSPSQINMFLKCPAQWAFRYVDGLKIPPSSSITLGNCYDDAMTTNYSQKIESKQDMPTDDIVDAFVTSFNIQKNDTEWRNDESPETFKDTGIKCVKKYQKEIASTIMPTAAQKKYEITFPNVNWTMVGIVDLETEDGYIVDNKTTGRTPSRTADGEYKIKPDHKFQMITYSIAKKITEGIESGNKLRLDYAITNKNPNIVQIEVPPPTQNDLKYFTNITAICFQQMEKIREDKIKLGDTFPMPNRNHNLCTKKWCGYWANCIKKFGGDVND